jgi:hypothetical protein
VHNDGRGHLRRCLRPHPGRHERARRPRRTRRQRVDRHPARRRPAERHPRCVPMLSAWPRSRASRSANPLPRVVAGARAVRLVPLHRPADAVATSRARLPRARPTTSWACSARWAWPSVTTRAVGGRHAPDRVRAVSPAWPGRGTPAPGPRPAPSRRR